MDTEMVQKNCFICGKLNQGDQYDCDDVCGKCAVKVNQSMDTETLNAAARLRGEVITLANGYDRTKHPEQMTFRRITLDEVKAINGGTYWVEDKHGKARQVRVASQLKTWKRDPTRFECSFKYGLYESFRWDTQEMLDNLLIQI